MVAAIRFRSSSAKCVSKLETSSEELTLDFCLPKTLEKFPCEALSDLPTVTLLTVVFGGGLEMGASLN